MLPTGDSGRIHPAQQRARSMRSRHQHDNVDGRITAMRNSLVGISNGPTVALSAESPIFAAVYDKTNQKCQRCALATRKSRKTWMRATDLSSSG
jgi:hypothetical protein